MPSQNDPRALYLISQLKVNVDLGSFPSTWMKSYFPLYFFGMGQEKWIGNDNNPAPIYQPCCHFLNIIFTNALFQGSGRGQSDDLASSKKTLKCQGKYFVPESWQIYAMNKCLKFRCHYFLWHKDNRIIRELHCFYTITKIEVSFVKGQKVTCITEEAEANDWIPFCLLSPPVVNSLVLFLPYKQNCNLQCNYYLTFASWLCCQNISFH